MKIKDLRTGMKKISVEAKVMEKTDTREVMSRFKDETYKVATALIADDTGTIKLTLWNDQINQVNVDNTVKVENGYVTSFKGEIQLNIGKYGTLTVE
ncbi:MAG TPA: OB-fold nucleic acid binding domain-containing protein [Candidatus Bathyarchaeia archaeon]|nr:OB-fold nucleic acid binding domain-containing protein [Candidatus Bathyarchaeia archaeon]